MERRIKILDGLTASKIAAGEVVERPASVVKELLENAIDAGATSISISIAEGGRRLIKVTDNGFGIPTVDAPLAVLRHATSKILSDDDLEGIMTLGFRGEALASIAAVSRLTIRTKQRGELTGTSVMVEGGSEPVIAPEGCNDGTAVTVQDLFFNTPARLKFLRSARGEFGRIMEIFKRTALIHPEITFRLLHDAARPLELVAGDLKQRIAGLFGVETAKGLVALPGPYTEGFIGSHELNYLTSKGLYTYVNGRAIRDRAVNRAVIDGYGRLIERSRYPFAVIDIKIPPEDVDVNIHPAKLEVRFKGPGAVYNLVKNSVTKALAVSSTPAGDKALSYRPAESGAGAGLMEMGLAYAPRPRESIVGGEGARPVSEVDFAPAVEGIKNPELLGLEVIGQIWGEFLLAQGDRESGKFYIIDQHGAAERAAFEGLKGSFYSSGIRRQLLLLPERVETSPEEKDALYGALEDLGRLGFQIVPFGPSTSLGGETFLVKAVPELLGSRRVGPLVKDLVEEISGAEGTEGSSRIEAVLEGVLMTIACHSVIRGPRPLTRQEGQALLTELAGIDFAGYCPHGRPVIKVISRAEVDAFFKR